MQLLRFLNSLHAQRAFSILGRIERDATGKLGRTAYPVWHFQYPRSDRAGCNAEEKPGGKRLVQTFSILGRIERDATVALRSGSWTRP